MARTGENIYKRKDGRWEGRYIQYYDASRKPKYGYVYAKTYSEVKQKLLDRRSHAYQPETLTSNSSVKYDEILAMWLQSSRRNIKESTYARYCQIIDGHIRPALGQYSLSKISTQQIESFIQDQLTSGRVDSKGGLSPKTVTDILTVLKASFAYAQNNGLLVTCNLQGISIKNREREMRVLTVQEQEALVRVLLSNIDLCKFGVMLSLYTGIRLGELCALQWENLCLSTSRLKVLRTLQRIQDRNNGAAAKTKVVITDPKSQCSIREIPLPQFIVELARQFETVPKAYVLTGDKSRYIEPRTLQNKFKRYIKSACVEDANFHSTRHTFATRCVEAGFDIKTLSEILGHANVNITLNRYVHSSFDLKCSNMRKLTLPF